MDYRTAVKILKSGRKFLPGFAFLLFVFSLIFNLSHASKPALNPRHWHENQWVASGNPHSDHQRSNDAVPVETSGEEEEAETENEWEKDGESWIHVNLFFNLLQLQESKISAFQSRSHGTDSQAPLYILFHCWKSCLG